MRNRGTKVKTRLDAESVLSVAFEYTKITRGQRYKHVQLASAATMPAAERRPAALIAYSSTFLW